MPAPIFHRTDLALVLSNRLLHPDTLQIAARDGLFLASNRQIGKTTFFRHDLIPQLEKENALVIYLDLWDNRERISASEAVLSKVRESLADLSRLSFLKAKPSDVFLQFDAKQVGTPAGVSLAQAFSEIIATYDVNVVLIIDEIQECSEAKPDLISSQH